MFGPLKAALDDLSVGVAGPFGISTEDLREFHDSDGPEVDAIEGYLMAFRRDVLRDVGLFDERFRWYRTADIECSFRIKDAGMRALRVDVPVIEHEHRMYHATPEAERDRLSSATSTGSSNGSGTATTCSWSLRPTSRTGRAGARCPVRWRPTGSRRRDAARAPRAPRG